MKCILFNIDAVQVLDDDDDDDDDDVQEISGDQARTNQMARQWSSGHMKKQEGKARMLGIQMEMEQ